jgi:hypothetical protein
MIDGHGVDKPVDHESWRRLRALYEWLTPATSSRRGGLENVKRTGSGSRPTRGQTTVS